MIGYPLDSHVTYEADGTPVYDRGVSSAPLRSLIKKLFSDGVMPNPSTNMQVVASTGMNVQVQAGFAITGGCLKLLESAETLTIEAASTLPRIDAIVLRLDDNDNVRTCELAVKKGTAASSPVAPTVRRDEVMWEICLAQIAVAANTTAITNANITDTRLDTDLCGYISSISEFDTTTLYQQIQSDLEFFREDEQARLRAWFDTFIDELTTDQAINLQNQINVLDYKIDNLDVLDTTEEIAANTDPGKITGALATKSVIDSLQASVQTKYDTDSGKPMWKEQGADTWNFFKSGFPKLVATRGYSAYGHTYVYLFFDVEDFDEVKVIYGTSGYYCFPNTITEPFANTYPISSNTVTTINTVGKKYLAVAGIAIDNASYSTNFVAFV